MQNLPQKKKSKLNYLIQKPEKTLLSTKFFLFQTKKEKMLNLANLT